MITGTMAGKVADYGESREEDTSMTMTSKGTALWMAPEVGIASRYDSQADVYSFGVVLYEIAKRDFPYRDQEGTMANFGMAYQVAMKGLRPTIDEKWNDGLKKLMRDCYKREPSERPTFAQVAVRLQTIIRDVGLEERGASEDQGLPTKTAGGSAAEGHEQRDENTRGLPMWKSIEVDARLLQFGKVIGRVGLLLSMTMLCFDARSPCVLTDTCMTCAMNVH